MAPGRVGLVLGAGGTAGHAFHAAVLSGLDLPPPDLIVGTSAGALIAALLRSGLPAAELFDADLLRRWQDARRAAAAGAGERGARVASPVRLAAGALLGRARWTSALAALAPPGRADGAVVADEVSALHPDGWPDQTWLVAVRGSDGRRVVFGRDGAPPPIGTAVAASSAVPGVYRPVVIDGVAYIDGGVHSTTNADLASGCTQVFVLAPMAGPVWPPSPVRTFANAALAWETAWLRLRGAQVTVIAADAAVVAATGADPLDPACREPVFEAATALASRRQLTLM